MELEGRPGPFYHVKTSVVDRGGEGSLISILHVRSSFWTSNSTFFASWTFNTPMLGAETSR